MGAACNATALTPTNKEVLSSMSQAMPARGDLQGIRLNGADWQFHSVEPGVQALAAIVAAAAEDSRAPAPDCGFAAL
jgi:hypothetical protein